ncbi:hypothetical protein F4806DRAFT_48825 [Annulohypoxylon nitens]|nr:hypothetical protein F4806DRAFT_48825 [Annulohypoxylon nitens]
MQNIVYLFHAPPLSGSFMARLTCFMDALLKSRRSSNIDLVNFNPGILTRYIPTLSGPIYLFGFTSRHNAMAEAALATVGAVASVVQLGDVALRLCRSISEFIGELKDAKDDMRRLQHTLDDTSSSMRNLIVYVRQFQDAPSTNERHQVLPEVVVNAIRRFHDILNSLRVWLPHDLSPSFEQKCRFVSNRKKIRSAISQLKGCQASTSLALNIVCSHSIINLRDELRRLRIDSETTAVEQRTALQNSSQQISQLSTEIQNISKQQTQVCLSSVQVDKRALDIATQLQSIHTMMAAQNIRSLQQVSTNMFTAADEETLAKMVRICVMKMVEIVTPETDKNETTKVDDLSTNIASQAHREKFFNTPAEEAMPTQTPSPETSTQRQCPAERSNIVRLFQRFETISFRWATINLCVTGLRSRQMGIQDSTSCFSIKLDFIPRRLLNFGVSLSYTNAPDCAGYYNICPTILTFNIIPVSLNIWSIIQRDDVDSLQHLIMNREIGIRDHDASGFSLLKIAMIYCSAKCVRYLLYGTGLSISTILDYSNLNGQDPPIGHALYSVIDVDLGVSRIDNYSLSIIDMRENGVPIIVDDVWGVLILSHHWGKVWQRNHPTYSDLIPLYRILKRMGCRFDLFFWISWPSWPEYAKNILYHEFCLRLCLEAGEDPNAPLNSCDQKRPLEVAVDFLGNRDHLSQATGVFSYTMLWTMDSLKLDTVSPSLFILLIKAGADIFFIRKYDGHFHSITDQAYERGIGYLWEAALIECGYDPAEVKAKSERLKMDCERQRIVDRQLRSAERSGVDTEPMEKVLSAQGLKQRPTTNRRAHRDVEG